jgi:hypothetical protein
MTAVYGLTYRDLIAGIGAHFAHSGADLPARQVLSSAS